MLVSAREDLPLRQPWQCVILDWYSRKHTHVARSTFAAKLHALIDAIGQSMLINLAITEIFQHVDKASDLAILQESDILQSGTCCRAHANCPVNALVPTPVSMTPKHGTKIGKP